MTHRHHSAEKEGELPSQLLLLSAISRVCFAVTTQGLQQNKPVPLQRTCRRLRAFPRPHTATLGLGRLCLTTGSYAKPYRKAEELSVSGETGVQDGGFLHWDQAIFKAAFFSGDRIADLMRVRTSDVCRLQSGALLMNHVWGKTLRDGRSNVLTLEKTGDSGSSTCPVVAIDWYVAIINTSFRRYLRKLGIDEGETLHGCRAGCAISLNPQQYTFPD
ncbi:hypothetical protein Bbelb_021900 [Branchiostoma belcheri]|nr:hypothetical protein Bbelb_021900 [Branchiostoma belcheri]